MQTVSIENMRRAVSDWNRSWRTWVIATEDGGMVSYWNGQRYPRLPNT